MTGFRGWSEPHAVVDPLTPESLRELLLSTPERVVVEQVADPGSGRAEAVRREDGRWRVQVSATEGTLSATTANADATFDALRSWAAGDDWWREAFSWEPVHR